MYPTLIQTDDEELKRRILISLQSRGVEILADAEVQVTGGVVTLSGKFASANDRLLALNAVGMSLASCVWRIQRKAERGFIADKQSDRELASIGGYASYLS